MLRVQRLRGWVMLPLLSVAGVAGLGASSPAVPLVEAAKKADARAVTALLKQRADVNAPETDGTTALHWAARKDDLKTADLLIVAGANANAKNRYGVTPLSLACLNGNAGMVERLLKAGADPNTIVQEGETAVMTAARTGNLETVKTLLAHGADVNAKEAWRGQTALMWAAAEGHSAVIRALIENGADKTARSTAGFSPLLYAVREGQRGAVETLLAAGASVNETFPVATAPARGRPTLDGGTSALVLAVMNAHWEVAGFLLDKGADPNGADQGWTALHELTWTRRPLHGTIPPPVGFDSVESLALVKKLVAHGADVNARMAEEPKGGYRHHKNNLKRVGATPFLLAARYADPELMRLLAELGADPLLPNEDNSTAITVAAGLGVYSLGEDPGSEAEVLEAVKVAFEFGGDVNAVDMNGETPMHGATYLGANTVIQFLVEKGAKLEIWNQPNKMGWTPLIIADGVYRAGNVKAAPHTAVVIRQLMRDGGLVPPPSPSPSLAPIPVAR